jgi:hypothetical protein
MPKRPANRTLPRKDETGRTWPPPKQAQPTHAKVPPMGTVSRPRKPSGPTGLSGRGRG